MTTVFGARAPCRVASRSVSLSTSAATSSQRSRRGKMTRTVTHLFDDYAQAQRAVEALEQAGFSSSEISLVSRYRSDGSLADDASGAATGATVGGLAGGGVG